VSTSCEFHYNDVIIMASFVFWTQSVSAVFHPRYSFRKFQMAISPGGVIRSTSCLFYGGVFEVGGSNGAISGFAKSKMSAAPPSWKIQMSISPCYTALQLASCEKNEYVQQTDLYKRQTLTLPPVRSNGRLVTFLFFAAKSPSSLGRSPRNFATWLEPVSIL